MNVASGPRTWDPDSPSAQFHLKLSNPPRLRDQEGLQSHLLIQSWCDLGAWLVTVRFQVSWYAQRGSSQIFRSGPLYDESSVTDSNGHPPSIEDTIVHVLSDADIREAIESFRVSQRFDLQVLNVRTPSTSKK